MTALTENNYPVRWFLLLTAICCIALPAALFIGLEFTDVYLPYHWTWLVAALCFQAVFAGCAWLFISRKQIPLQQLLGKLTRQDLGVAVEFTVLNIALTLVVLYAIYYPLSLQPQYAGWVADMLLAQPQVIIFDGSSYPLFANLMVVISIVVLAPVLEEILFRGILFRRWLSKYGFKVAAGLSSLLFGVLHGEVISAFIFGLLLSLIYQRSQRLLLPILVHALNNLSVWVISALDAAISGHVEVYDLAQFQSEWHYGVVGAAILIVWAGFALKKRTTLVAIQG